MKTLRIIGILLGLGLFHWGKAQETMRPSDPQKAPFYLVGGTLNLGNGEVRENKVLGIEKGKIKYYDQVPTGVGENQIFDTRGKQIYPGLIGLNNNLGLVEITSTNSTHDLVEIGTYNPNVRSLVGYNADSKVINTVRSNGILLVEVAPWGGHISGTSSVVQLDAWNWEDAAYATDRGIHMHVPSLMRMPGEAGNAKNLKANLEEWEEIKGYFNQAFAYFKNPKPLAKNLKFEAMKGLFTKDKILFVHADWVKEILLAIELKKQFDLRMVIVGGIDAWRIGHILKENEVSVVLYNPHNLPVFTDDAIDLPYKTGKLLRDQGVIFSISTEGMEGFMQLRNTPFLAGTLVAYGLSKAEALKAITGDAAKILGIDSFAGTLEEGKDANIVVSAGDLLDMRTHEVQLAFIQGRPINLDNKHKQLYNRYLTKYKKD